LISYENVFKTTTKKPKPRNQYLIKPRVMTRGSEAKVKIKARDETHSDKMSSCTVKKEVWHHASLLN
ncbi:MAG: hypothetical protein II846_05800, partial [Acetobacter sp.]|nr:hypothetical protein [Acetobacter sp.]